MLAGWAKLVASMLVVAILSGAQCLSLCTTQICITAEAPKVAAEKPSCHSHHQNPQPKRSDAAQNCSHQEFVAEKGQDQASVAVADLLFVLPDSPVHLWLEVVDPHSPDPAVFSVPYTRTAPTILRL